jgi:hypothetical protein
VNSGPDKSLWERAAIVILNPPGSPAQTVESDRIYTRRNDNRFS